MLTSLDVPKMGRGEKATAEARSERKRSTDFIAVYNIIYIERIEYCAIYNVMMGVWYNSCCNFGAAILGPFSPIVSTERTHQRTTYAACSHSHQSTSSTRIDGSS